MDCNKYYILLKDQPFSKGSKFKEFFTKSKSQKEKLKPSVGRAAAGTLLKNDGKFNSKYFPCEQFDDSVGFVCPSQFVSALSHEEYEILAPIRRPAECLEVYRDKTWLNEGIGLRDGDRVRITEHPDVRNEAVGVVLPDVPVEGRSGRWFRVELENDGGRSAGRKEISATLYDIRRLDPSQGLVSKVRSNSQKERFAKMTGELKVRLEKKTGGKSGGITVHYQPIGDHLDLDIPNPLPLSRDKSSVRYKSAGCLLDLDVDDDQTPCLPKKDASPLPANDKSGQQANTRRKSSSPRVSPNIRKGSDACIKRCKSEENLLDKIVKKSQTLKPSQPPSYKGSPGNVSGSKRFKSKKNLLENGSERSHTLKPTPKSWTGEKKRYPETQEQTTPKQNLSVPVQGSPGNVSSLKRFKSEENLLENGRGRARMLKPTPKIWTGERKQYPDTQEQTTPKQNLSVPVQGSPGNVSSLKRFKSEENMLENGRERSRTLKPTPRFWTGEKKRYPHTQEQTTPKQNLSVPVQVVNGHNGERSSLEFPVASVCVQDVDPDEEPHYENWQHGRHNIPEENDENTVPIQCTEESNALYENLPVQVTNGSLTHVVLPSLTGPDQAQDRSQISAQRRHGEPEEQEEPQQDEAIVRLRPTPAPNSRENSSEVEEDPYTIFGPHGWQTDLDAFQVFNPRPASLVLYDRINFTVNPEDIFDQTYELNTRLKYWGTLLIIDQFTKHRRGSGVDVEAIINVFEKLFHFRVDYQKNLSKKDFIGVMKKHVAYMAEPRNRVQRFVCFILGHGDENGIKTCRNCRGSRFDEEIGTHVKINEDIVPLFSSSKLQAMAGKPKLFFVQACQGLSLQGGQSLQGDADINAVQAEGNEEPPIMEAIPQPSPSPISVPNDADVLIAYAQTPGYQAYRDPKSGSWFVQAVTDIFHDYHQEYDVLRLLTMVSYAVSIHSKTNADGTEEKQMPFIQHTLRKQMFMTR